MNNKTIKKLNQINADFYKTTAIDFDDSRHYFWSGWEQIPALLDSLTKKLDEKPTIKVADVGCGNGRFGEFLYEKLSNHTLSYTGIDGNQTLLNFAEKTLKGKIPALHLQETDIISELLNKNDFLGDQKFSLICSFGVFHHIPSYELRVKAIKYLLSKLEKDGLLIISLWQFIEFKRFQKKIVLDSTSKNNLDVNQQTLKSSELEKNDYILDWKRGKQALRYCHFYDNEEQDQLIIDTNSILVKKYRDDGKEGNLNQYIVLQKKE